jgi:hypothetical protein
MKNAPNPSITEVRRTWSGEIAKNCTGISSISARRLSSADNR